MQALAERQGIPVFNSIPVAVDGIAKVCFICHSNKKKIPRISFGLKFLYPDAFVCVGFMGKCSCSRVGL